ncbi:restriction endonuclease [Stutzerimonas degradans]|nr:restriction endonuclease [Stutzerimonas degradans]
MIEDPYPDDWRKLQTGVRKILRNIGLQAEVEVDVATPRGTINVDVLAVDTRSVDKIKYIVECKNWNNAIPQHVVHSFTTVMHEIGANIGFIISKHGLQSGAKQYTTNTNIVGLTYLEFQQRYFSVWWKRYFCPRIGDAADRLLQYVEPCNQRRDRAYEKLSDSKREQFDKLRARYEVHAMTLSMFNLASISPNFNTGTLLIPPSDLEHFKEKTLSMITPGIEWHCTTFSGLLEIILKFLQETEDMFNELFGEFIFDITPLSEVTVEGPPLEDI